MRKLGRFLAKGALFLGAGLVAMPLLGVLLLCSPFIIAAEIFKCCMEESSEETIAGSAMTGFAHAVEDASNNIDLFFSESREKPRRKYTEQHKASDKQQPKNSAPNSYHSRW